MAKLENCKQTNAVDLELLALFDDVTALSALENNTLGAAYYDFFLEEQCTPKLDSINNNEAKMDDRLAIPKHKAIEKDCTFVTPKMYSCASCVKQFYSRTASRRHQVYHMKQRLCCSYCMFRSYSVTALRRHTDYFHYRPRNRHVLVEAQ